ncbi:hypothetical protein G6F51_014488 [Rhizopus arrhizus]|uniref:Uncharacterized protein n=1 Tax=Rhizopus oryzae TaxID=64495 RepID=A0A9P6XMC0_RHIOR|nr:hypothetical protein G6F51_014488 [Rhizopus arrhizus]
MAQGTNRAGRPGSRGRAGIRAAGQQRGRGDDLAAGAGAGERIPTQCASSMGNRAGRAGRHAAGTGRGFRASGRRAGSGRRCTGRREGSSRETGAGAGRRSPATGRGREPCRQGRRPHCGNRTPGR